MSAMWGIIWRPVWADLWYAPFPAYEEFHVSDDDGASFQVDDGAGGYENFEVRE
jgi:hypothetical protein